jgi:hypothetical protein
LIRSHSGAVKLSLPRASPHCLAVDAANQLRPERVQADLLSHAKPPSQASAVKRDIFIILCNSSNLTAIYLCNVSLPCRLLMSPVVSESQISALDFAKTTCFSASTSSTACARFHPIPILLYLREQHEHNMNIT